MVECRVCDYWVKPFGVSVVFDGPSTLNYNVLLELGVSTTMHTWPLKFLALSTTNAGVTRQCWVVTVELINSIVVITNTMSINVCTKQFAALETFYTTQLSAHIEDISEQNANWNRTGPLVKCCSPAGVLWCSPWWFWQWTQSFPQADSPRTGPWPWPRTRPRPITRTSYDYFCCGSWQSSMCSFMFKWETMFWLCGKRLCGTRKVKLQKHGSLTRFRMVHRLCSLTELICWIT